MTQQGKQMIDDARKGFAYDLVEMAFWPTATSMRLIPKRFFFFLLLSGKAL
jgi:hypothetical protein